MKRAKKFVAENNNTLLLCGRLMALVSIAMMVVNLWRGYGLTTFFFVAFIMSMVSATLTIILPLWAEGWNQ